MPIISSADGFQWWEQPKAINEEINELERKAPEFLEALSTQLKGIHLNQLSDEDLTRLQEQIIQAMNDKLPYMEKFSPGVSRLLDQLRDSKSFKNTVMHLQPFLPSPLISEYLSEVKQSNQEVGGEAVGHYISSTESETNVSQPSEPSLTPGGGSSKTAGGAGSSSAMTLQEFETYISGSQFPWSSGGAEFHNLLLAIIRTLPPGSTMDDLNANLRDYVGDPNTLFKDAAGNPMPIGTQDTTLLENAGLIIPTGSPTISPSSPNTDPNHVPINIRPPEDWDFSKDGPYTVHVVISGRPSGPQGSLVYYDQNGNPRPSPDAFSITFHSEDDVETLKIPIPLYSYRVELQPEQANKSFRTDSPVLIEGTNDTRNPNDKKIVADISGVNNAQQAGALLDFEANYASSTAGVGMTRKVTLPPQLSGTTKNLQDIANKMKTEMQDLISGGVAGQGWDEIFKRQQGLDGSWESPPVAPKNVYALRDYYNQYLTDTYLSENNPNSIKDLTFQAPNITDGSLTGYTCIDPAYSFNGKTYIVFKSKDSIVMLDQNLNKPEDPNNRAWWDGGYEGRWMQISMPPKQTDGIQVYSSGNFPPNVNNLIPFDRTGKSGASIVVPSLIKDIVAPLNVGFNMSIFKDPASHGLPPIPSNGISGDYLKEVPPSFRYQTSHYDLYMRTGLDQGLNTYLFDFQDVLGMDNTRVSSQAQMVCMNVTLSNVHAAGPSPPPSPLQSIEDEIMEWAQGKGPGVQRLAHDMINEIEKLGSTATLRELQTWFQAVPGESGNPGPYAKSPFLDPYYGYPGVTPTDFSSLCGYIKVPYPGATDFDRALAAIANASFPSLQGQEIQQKLEDYIITMPTHSPLETLKVWTQNNIFKSDFWTTYSGISQAEVQTIEQITGATAPDRGLADIASAVHTWDQQFHSGSPQDLLAQSILKEISALGSSGRVKDLWTWFDGQISKMPFKDIYYGCLGLTPTTAQSLFSALEKTPVPIPTTYDQIIAQLTNTSFLSSQGSNIQQQIIAHIESIDPSGSGATMQALASWVQSHIFTNDFWGKKQYQGISITDVKTIETLIPGTHAPPFPSSKTLQDYLKKIDDLLEERKEIEVVLGLSPTNSYGWIMAAGKARGLLGVLQSAENDCKSGNCNFLADKLHLPTNTPPAELLAMGQRVIDDCKALVANPTSWGRGTQSAIRLLSLAETTVQGEIASGKTVADFHTWIKGIINSGYAGYPNLTAADKATFSALLS